jgi:2-polyprenyl-6-methoxyphenol hydroxylase-like FAD-dependent oxidoreductase
MALLKVLICGGGIPGPSLAFWLSKLNYDITIVERFPGLRAGGQQIDLRGQGVQVMRKMGIEQVVRSKVVDEEGIQFVDTTGKRMAFVEANKSGKGKQTATSEFEIMRGDLCYILHDLIKDKVKYVFGVFVTSFQQDEDSVKVQFSDGTDGTFDLVVGADGQSSRTRRMLLGPDTPDTFRSFGIYASYFNIPQQPGDLNIGTMYYPARRRFIFTRRDNPRTLQAYLQYATKSGDETMDQALKKGVSEQKEAFAEVFQGSGWQSDRIIEGMRNSDDFYATVVGQVRLDSWSRGRVILLGDAAWAPALSGMGTSAALISSYVLAGELAKHAKGGSSDSFRAALVAWEARFRPFVDKIQDISPWFISSMYPETQLAIRIVHFIVWFITTLRLDKLLSRLSSDDVPGWDLPEYPELGTQG